MTEIKMNNESTNKMKYAAAAKLQVLYWHLLVVHGEKKHTHTKPTDSPHTYHTHPTPPHTHTPPPTPTHPHTTYTQKHCS